MSHVDDGQLNALLDGELSAADARAVESHVATCAECRRRLEEARAFLQEASSLLESLSPRAEPAAASAPPAQPREQPARPSRQSVPVRPVGPLADLPVEGGPAGPMAPVPPAARQPVSPPAAPGSRKPPKTAREVAVDIDGRTALTPGIRPLFAEEAPAGVTGERGRARRGWDFEKLAWAANIVLALGVGYLANEVRWMHSERPPASRVDTVLVAAAQRADAAHAPAAAAPAAAAPAAGPAEQKRTPVTSNAPRQLAAQPSHRTTAPPSRSGVALVKPSAARTKAHPPRPVLADNISVQPPAAANADAQHQRQAPVATLPRSLPQQAEGRAALGAGLAGGAAAPAPPARAPSAASGAANRATLDEAGRSGTPGFSRITMEEAVHTLSGSIRQIDGMTPTRIESAGGRLVSGSDPSREVVRVNYTDQFGRHFTLDQQLAEPRAGPAFIGVLPGDTLVTITAEGSSRVRWINGKFWLSLTGPVAADQIKALIARVR